MITAKLNDISKKYGEINALKEVSLDIHTGELLSILGSSGCGKSTLLYSIAGLEKPDSGDISLNGRTIFSASERTFIPPEKRNIGLVFQNYALWPHMNIYKNVAYPLQIRKVKKSIIKKEVLEKLELVGLSGKEKKYPHELSGGEQQRAAVARGLIMKPDILLLDEPFSNLDAKLREKMQDELKRIQKLTKLTMVHVTHDQEEAMRISDRIAIMNKGRLLQIGEPSEIYDRPKDVFVAGFVGKSNLISYDTIKNYLPRKVKNDLEEKSLNKTKTILVRPEDITITDTENNTISGVITNKFNKGSVYMYNIKTGFHDFVIQTDNRCNYDINSNVNIMIKKGCVI
ncbi:ABC transporter ATP-binding protein [Vallitalea guaymasensis]|uniref:ABC-type quaternary amine transporter n=1 Tax=Vallitalea guaymasensis TaxID=1185412 RepID=A0A8J8M7B8_9FIRM|nr:ABC transporter ATP-binding protein [Vallitalea guaymasensis]QUH27500.1 ABC transporter ATP-binding protein [Vallitalea guaymasensis]